MRNGNTWQPRTAHRGVTNKMASSTPHTIVISDQPFVQEEYVANGGTITPGDLIELASATAVKLHATQAGNAQALFAIEDPFNEAETAAAIDTTYGTADTIYAIAGRPGDQIYAWLQHGGSVSVGGMLESAGSQGALQAYAAGTAEATHSIVAKALETKDNSGGSARARIKVEVV